MDPRTHIDRLLRAFPTARNVSSNPNEYVGIFEIPLTVNNNLLIQRIYLRYNFPSVYCSLY